LERRCGRVEFEREKWMVARLVDGRAVKGFVRMQDNRCLEHVKMVRVDMES
jgi:hypothetical protein